MPSTDEISEDGFGYFRGTWLIGRVPVAEAQATVSLEGEIIDWLDEVAACANEFEMLASAIETVDPDSLTGSLRTGVARHGLEKYLPDDDGPVPLDGLEIGVA
jgi:hypothetical protein